MSQNKFDKLNDYIRETESSIVNFLSVFAPWLAPLVPAYMTFQHAVSPIMEFPWFVALPAALVVEILGFSAVSTSLAFWFHNKKVARDMNRKIRKGKKPTHGKKSIRRAPIEIVIFAFGFYLALILASNVLLDTFPYENWAVITVRALFTLQTIPAALIVAVRTQHRELLSELSKSKLQKDTETFQKVSEEDQTLSENLPKDWRKLRPTLNETDLINLANLSTNQVKDFAKKYHVEEKTIYNWKKNAAHEIGYYDEPISPLNEEEEAYPEKGNDQHA